MMPQFTFKTHFTNTIYEVMLEKGWTAAEDDNFNFAWLEKYEVPVVYKKRVASLNSANFFINHYYNHYQITRKDLLAANINKTLRLLQKFNSNLLSIFQIIPTTFIIPQDFPLFQQQRQNSQQYIVKPANLAQGKGIFIAAFQDVCAWYKQDYPTICQYARELDEQREDGPRCGHYLYLVQQYVERPLLVNGHKFDLRIYVLVRQMQPLDVWICRHGFARFALTQYALGADKSSQLTNIAIQKHVQGYNKDLDGAKWSLFELSQYLRLFYPDDEVYTAFRDAELLIVRTLQIAAPLMTQNRCSFEIYGFDVMFDERLRPVLLEVNASPSLSADTEEDLIIKKCMLHDALALVVYRPEKSYIYGCWHQVLNTPRVVILNSELLAQGDATAAILLNEGVVVSGAYLGGPVRRAEYLL